MDRTDKNNHNIQHLEPDQDRFGFYVEKSTQRNLTMPSYHTHFHYEILYITSGEKEIVINNSTKYTLNSDYIALIKPHLIHQISSTSPNIQQRVMIYITDDLMQEFFNFASPCIADCFNTPVLKLSAYTQKMLNYFLSSLTSLTPDSPYYEMRGKVLIINILLLLTDEFNDQHIKESEQATRTEHFYAKQIAEYIADNYYKPITISDLAIMFHFSKAHISRIFKNSMNTTLHKYLVGVRIVNAKQLLLEDNATIHSVAYQCGFSSPEIFSRAFRQYIGFSPTDFIRRNREATEQKDSCI